MSKIVIDDVLLKEPSLYVPRMQPAGPVNLIKQKNSLVERLTYFLIFNQYYTEPDPYNGVFELVSKARYSSDGGYAERNAIRADIGGTGICHDSSLISNIYYQLAGNFNDLDVKPHSAFVVFSLRYWPGNSIIVYSQTNVTRACGIFISSGSPNVISGRSGTDYNTFSTYVGTQELHCVAWSALDGNFRFAHNGVLAATSTELDGWGADVPLRISMYATAASAMTLYAYGGFKDVFLTDAELISITNDPYQFVEPA